MILNLIAAMSAAAAAIFLGLRAQMLKPILSSWPDAPRCVRYATFGLSVVLGGYTVHICNGGQATASEALILFALAAYGGLLWLNLFRQVRGQA